MSAPPAYEWRDSGAFRDADGISVRAYDDVVLLQEASGKDRDGSPLAIPANTVATVLFFQAEPDGVADLECNWPNDAFSFAAVPTRLLRLHLTAEQKRGGGA